MFRLLLQLILWRPVRWIVVAGVVAAGFVGVAAWQYYAWRAGRFDLDDVKLPAPLDVYDRNGQLYFRIGSVVPFTQIPQSFRDALVAREDSRFWQHSAIDPIGIVRAAFANLCHGRIRQGGSDLIQQLAKNTFHLEGRNIGRKLLEAQLAERIFRNYTREQIIESYVNRIYFGETFYGIEEAARGYFGKPASKLDLAESAMLAGLIRSPNKLSPFKHREKAIAVRGEVLARMVTCGMITQEQADRAQSEKFTRSRPATVNDGYLQAEIRHAYEKLTTVTQRREGGMRIYVTIDPDLQRLASAALENGCAKIEPTAPVGHHKTGKQPTQADPMTGAVTVIENRSGAILASVGGRDYRKNQFNCATEAMRPPASNFKPFIYALFFQKGHAPSEMISDDRIERGEFHDCGSWSPANADHIYTGLQQAEYGLIHSRNTMTVRVGESVGLAQVGRFATSLGIIRQMPDSPTAFLGTMETTPRKLATAFTIFPNGGLLRESYLVERIDFHGATIYLCPASTASQVLGEKAAVQVSETLEKVLQVGTAARARQLGVNFPAAGKTGTSSRCKDAWFLGYTSRLTVGVWLGREKGSPIVGGASGASVALPVWAEIITRASARKTYAAGPLPHDSAVHASAPEINAAPEQHAIAQEPSF